MYYIPSAPTLETLQTPSVLRVHTYGAFLCDRPLSLLNSQSFYLSQVPPRLIISTLSNVRMDRYNTSFNAPDTPSKERTCSLTSAMPSWTNLNVNPGDNSMLIGLGLVPSISRDSEIGVELISGDYSDDLEVEVARNTTFDVSKWQETSIQIVDENIYDIIPNRSDRSVPPARVNDGLHHIFPESRSSFSQLLLTETNLLASSSSFFGGMLAASSSPNMGDIDDGAPCDSNEVAFSIPVNTQRLSATNSEIDAFQHSDDAGYDVSLELFPELSLNEQFSFEFDFPLLPSDSDAAEFIADSLTLLQQITYPAEGPTLIKGHLPHNMHFDNPSAFSSSTVSFVIPAFSSMEDLLGVTLDIPDVSVGSPFSSMQSLCSVPTLSSVDDLTIQCRPPNFILSIRRNQPTDLIH
ncbi:hypothetical protein K439DRAFT_232614 [Ramaria rubella]|nr:hypothetical protein K439DRAFT_232614 [Ramaria rubella]